MEWLNNMARSRKKTPEWVVKKLEAYRLGYKAGGAIIGVRIVVNDDCCQAAQQLRERTFGVDEVPHLPLEGCPYGEDCRCDYRPVMTDSVRTRPGASLD